ncbi:hypothetical protein B7463_g3438, partial [Scytalidium lignicola]
MDQSDLAIELRPMEKSRLYGQAGASGSRPSALRHQPAAFLPRAGVSSTPPSSRTRTFQWHCTRSYTRLGSVRGLSQKHVRGFMSNKEINKKKNNQQAEAAPAPAVLPAH